MQTGDRIILGYKPDHFSVPDIFQYELSHYAKMIYMYLQRHLTIEGELAPGKQEIAYYCECSRRTVFNALKELEQVGLIRIINRPIGKVQHDTNLYIIYHPEQVGLKKKPLYAEVKFAKKKKPNAPDALPQKGNAPDALPQKPNAPDALPPEESRNDAGSDEGVMHQVPGTRLIDIDSIERLEEELTDTEIVQVMFKKYLKEELTSKQADKMIEIALAMDISMEELIEEMKYIAAHVKIQKTADATLYSCLKDGGWAKKKREEAEKERQKPKPRLVRRPVKPNHVSDLPKAIREQMEKQAPAGDQPTGQDQDESLEAKQARIREKLRTMNARFAAQPAEQPN